MQKESLSLARLRNGKRSLTMPFRLSALAFTLMLGGGAALADDLNLGASYVPVVVDENGVGATNVGGGPITGSTLNGQQLAYVYCVGFFTDVYVPDDYPDTIVSHNGIANGAPIHNAGQIAWLVDTYAAASLGNTILEQALQAAIWSVEYDNTAETGEPDITGDPSQAYYAQYTADLAALGSNTAPVNTIDWFSPGDASGTVYQALVGPPVGAVPEPTSILLLGTILFLFAILFKRTKFGISR